MHKKSLSKVLHRVSSKNKIQKKESKLKVPFRDIKAFEEPATIEEKRKRYACGEDFTTLEDILPYPDFAKENDLKIELDFETKAQTNDQINSKISLWKGDITTLEIDAIVNAANESLLGGGGIDGAIHKAAGPHLRRECATLNGCKTGNTKITKGYKLPAKYVLHTVGPVGEDPKLLKGCYQSCLNLIEQHHIRSVAFCCISTGIFGYPLENATHIALSTVRNWLEEKHDKVDRIIFVVFLDKEKEIYEKLLPVYFPLEARKVPKAVVNRQIQLLEWQLRQFEDYNSNDRSNIDKKLRKKQKKEKKESLTEKVKREREKKYSIYKENLKMLKRKRHGALVDKQKQLLKLLQAKE